MIDEQKYEEPPQLTAEDEAILNAIWDRKGPGYDVGWDARRAGQPVESGADVANADNWRRGWNDCDEELKRCLARLTIDTIGVGNPRDMAVIVNGVWTSANPDLAGLLNQRLRVTGIEFDENAVKDAKRYLGLTKKKAKKSSARRKAP